MIFLITYWQATFFRTLRIFGTYDFWKPKGTKCPKEQSQALIGLGLFFYQGLSFRKWGLNEAIMWEKSRMF